MGTTGGSLSNSMALQVYNPEPDLIVGLSRARMSHMSRGALWDSFLPDMYMYARSSHPPLVLSTSLDLAAYASSLLTSVHKHQPYGEPLPLLRLQLNRHTLLGAPLYKAALAEQRM